ncbi:hypothetical protein GXY_08589 [Novacetimonas hansenii ATCC 23769]|uniref:Uncharacterized protein n=1 Tax=Novacetimonas hansenii ATCC 23769 TaxID=714995 RepID=D5QF02_NOVHA|nr:hypothetical protein GXY_08589 [Novacetimonas hansenii ATCC 23769]
MPFIKFPMIRDIYRVVFKDMFRVISSYRHCLSATCHHSKPISFSGCSK